MNGLHRVARGTDTPVPIFFWDPPEFVAAIALLGLGIIMHAALFGMIGAVVILSLAKKMKEGAKRAQMQHIMWRLGIPLDPALENFPGSTRTEFIS